jgi:simple sugar transport system substrate-binding protein
MRKMRTVLASFAAFSLVLAACGGDDDDNAGSSTGSAEATGGATSSATESSAASETGGSASATAPESSTAGGSDTVTAEQGTDLTFHMITHSDDGPFWSVVHRGMDAACEDLGVTCVWMASNNDPGKQVQLIDQLIPPLQAAVAAGIPVITLNSGSNDYQSIGALTHVGQTEFIAGQGAGNRFNDLGATHILCGRQEQSNVALEERCNGLADTFKGTVDSEFIGLDTDQTGQQNTIAAAFQADPSIDGFMGTGPVIAVSGLNAATDAGKELKGIAGFDITPEIIDAIKAGTISFTIDQQQYLQGYLPILLLYLYVTNLNVAGGGLPILTGPGFVDQTNADKVADLVTAGTR